MTDKTLRLHHKRLHKQKAQINDEIRALNRKRISLPWREGESEARKAILKEMAVLQQKHILLTIEIKHGRDAALLYKLSDGAIDPRKEHTDDSTTD